MGEPLSVDTDGLRSLGAIHASVARALADLGADPPQSAGVATSHGTIADGVATALAAALDSRSGAISAGRRNAEDHAELLHRTAMAYERADEEAGTTVEAAADSIDLR
ncbi:MAG: type VII secretion target [Mycolicibacterium sp.]|uniref:type VII secretion target n=1 Tax=Mycolicibacterium sp. TaxID=2320850 RepID=UPI003D0F13F6